MNWFTADPHFGHANIIKYCNRPFASVQEMDQYIIKKWQEVVSPQDHVFHLGDFGLADPQYLHRILQQLPGRIHYIRGNHDSGAVVRVLEPRCVWIKEIWHGRLKAGGQRVNLTLCHYPMKSWSKSGHGAIQLFGHVHEHYKFGDGKSLNVGVDHWGFAPVALETIVKELDKRENDLPGM